MIRELRPGLDPNLLYHSRLRVCCPVHNLTSPHCILKYTTASAVSHGHFMKGRPAVDVVTLDKLNPVSIRYAQSLPVSSTCTPLFFLVICTDGTKRPPLFKPTVVFQLLHSVCVMFVRIIFPSLLSVSLYYLCKCCNRTCNLGQQMSLVVKTGRSLCGRL